LFVQNGPTGFDCKPDCAAQFDELLRLAHAVWAWCVDIMRSWLDRVLPAYRRPVRLGQEADLAGPPDPPLEHQAFRRLARAPYATDTAA
jgi:hypothetical protein